MQLCSLIIVVIQKVLNYMVMILPLFENFMEVMKFKLIKQLLLFLSDPPSEVSIPSEEITTEIIEYTTLPPITTNIIETTTTTLMTTMTTTILTSPITTLALIKEEQIPDETTTTRNSSTQRWLQSYYTTTAPPIQVNYTDRSKLDLCDGFYDAITMYKGILFIFKGQVCVISLVLHFE
jgi:hypothetical protein